jgi:hypothetical protein
VPTAPAAPPFSPSQEAKNGESSFKPGAGFMAAGFKPAPPEVNSQPVSPAQPVSPPPPSVPAYSSPYPSAAEEPPKKGVSKGVIVASILVLLLGLSVLGFSKARSILSGASGESGCTPSGLREENLTQSSVEIVYTTGSNCKTSVVYGTSREALLLEVPESLASVTHRVRLSPLLPSTTYYYQVSVNGNGVGIVRSFLTKSNQPAAETVPTTAPVVPTVVPTQAIAPTIVPTTAPASGSAYAVSDFMDNIGPVNSTNSHLDINKDGMVNNSDWIDYQLTPTPAR